MTQSIWSNVDTYFHGTVVTPDDLVRAAVESSKASGLPDIQVSPSQGKLLHLLARIAGARRILEIGTLGGYSAIWMARALPADGRLVSLELDQRHADVARANVERAGLSDRVEIRVGPALELLPRLVSEMKQLRDAFDMVFIDADKANMPEYLAHALEMARPGAIIVGDNVVRGGQVVNDVSRDADVQGVRRFLEVLGDHPRLSATAIQTVGVKGYDGFALALVT